MITPEPARTLRLVYVGQRQTTSGPLSHFYVREDGTDWGGRRKPLVAGHRIGTLIELTHSEGERFWISGPDGPRPLGAAETFPVEQVTAWELEDGVARAEAAKAATERRLAKEVGSPLEEALAPLADALNRLPWPQRAAAVQLIIARLR